MKGLSLIFALSVVSATFAIATDISGPVSGVWDPSGNPYNFIDSVWVPEGDILTILAGVDIDWVSNATAFSAYGRLEALGSPENRIDMTSGPDTFLKLNLLGSDADADYVQNVDLNGAITLGGADHVLDGIELYVTKTLSGELSENGIEGPASDVSVLNCDITVSVSTSFPWVSASAYGITDISGIVGNCILNITAFNSCSEMASFATAVGLEDCSADIRSNRIFVHSSANYLAPWCGATAYGIYNCSGLKESNFICSDVYDWGSTRGIINDSPGPGSGDVINNTIHLQYGCGHGIRNPNGNVINNVLYGQYMTTPSTGIECDSGSTASISYNTQWGFTTYFENISLDMVGNRTENPQFDLDTGLLLPNSPCINRGHPAPEYNDPDGTRNDRGWMPFDPGNGPNFVSSQNRFDFGTVTIGTSAERSVTFTNIGLSAGEILSWSSSNPAYIVLEGIPSGPVPPGDSTQVTIQFFPQQYVPPFEMEVSLEGNMPPYHLAVIGEGAAFLAGDLTTAMTLTMANSPYYLIGDLNILPSGSLIVEPGVTVLATGLYHLVAQGDFLAVGTEADSIWFVPSSAGVEWYGFDIMGGPGSKNMAYCVIEGAIGDPAYDYNGGAIAVLNDDIQLSNCRISGNRAEAGAGLYIENGSLIVDSSVFNENEAMGTDSLSIICATNSTTMLENNCILGNVSTDWVLFINGGEINSFERNIIGGNSGIGVRIDGATMPMFDHGIIAGNTAGIEISTIPGIHVSGRNLILYGNGSGTPSEQFCIEGGVATLRYCDVQGGWPGTGNINVDPLFVDPENGDYHLKSQAGSYHQGQWLPDSLTSPCIDAGDPLSPYGNEPEPNGDRTNMGTYGNTGEASKSIDDPIYFAGPVSGVWTTAVNPKYMIGEIYVPEDQTLEIEPGVQVVFLGHYKFIVNGTLDAVGTETDSILFTAANPDTGWHGIRFIGASDSCRLEYCRIEYGNATGEPYDNCGGGIYGYSCQWSGPTISHCLISNCKASSSGGGIYFGGSQGTISDCEISHNQAYYGGGLVNSVWVSHCIIRNNTAEGYGGGIKLTSSATLVNCYITDNEALKGGGLYSISSNPMNPAVIESCFICGNYAEQQGAGLYFDCSTNSIIWGCDICYNTGDPNDFDGGGIYSNGTLTVTYAKIYGHHDVEHGGGIYNCGSLTAEGLAVYDNSAEWGGGIYTWTNSLLDLNKCTIGGNTATESTGGGVHHLEGTLEMRNSIVWGNQPEQFYIYSLPTTMVFWSDIQGNWTGPGLYNINVYPEFVDTTYNDLRLQWGSPCINYGDPNPLYNDPDGTRADMGAFYYDQSIPVRVLLTPHQTPIEIPPEGGSFDYTLRVTNIMSPTQMVDVWCDVNLPDGSVFGPVFGPFPIAVYTGVTESRERTQTVPERAPGGFYFYNAYATIAPDTSTDHSTFFKHGTDFSGEMLAWTNVGDPFDPSGTDQKNLLIPTTYSLDQNYPNPFNPFTTIRFGLPKAGPVHLAIYNLLGQQVEQLIHGYQDAGFHEVSWDASTIPSGVYICRIQAGDFITSNKIVLLK